ncbi:MAG: DUF2071 domain-containing protein [Chloroflexota bacterium]
MSNQPPANYAMQQTWHDLLFMHWPVPPAMLNAILPPPLTVDTWQGEAWVAVVPFGMRGIRFRGLPALPLTSTFLELNVRTYVTVGDKPGVWFYSLDASNRGAVEVARVWYNLPYFNAGMVMSKHAGTIRYAMHRTDRRANPAVFAGTYAPTSDVFRSEPGSLEEFLTERYYLYSVDRHGKLYRGRIYHEPWPLQTAEADMHINSVAASHGIHLPQTAPLLHFAQEISVYAQAIVPVYGRTISI